MGARFSRAVVGLVLLCPGCMFGEATHVLSSRVHQAVEGCAERRRNAQWAEEAWVAVVRCAGPGLSEDYARGFKNGFADFLYFGRGEPPPLPPEHYRGLKYQTPQGYRAIEDWFAGYRHGAAAAAQSGKRELVTGPSSLRQPVVLEGPAQQAVVVPSMPGAPEPALAPRPVPAPAQLPPPVPAAAADSGQGLWNWRVKVRFDWGEWKWW
jgi:hypothetical protein